MRFVRSFLPAAIAISTMGFAIAVKADTVTARCDVYPKLVLSPLAIAMSKH